MTDPLQWYTQALDAFHRGDWPEVQRLSTSILQHAPSHGGVHYLAGVAALQLQQLPRALGHLRRAAQSDPQHMDYLVQYARGLAMTGHLREALLVADAAIALPSGDASAFDTLGVIYSRANAHRQAADAFGRAVALMPGHANYRFNLATSLTFFGELDAAEQEYEACIAADPQYWRAHLGLAQLRKQTPDSNHCARLGSLLSRHSRDIEAQLYLHLALAKELEDVGDYTPAFEHYVRGKSAFRPRTGYSTQRDTADIDRLMAYFDRPQQGDRSGFQNDEPIFVIGMPRTGTTLVDRILSSHSHVYSAGELDNFGSALRALSGAPPTLAGMLDRLGPGFYRWHELGQHYIDSTRPQTGQMPRFVDKLPHNFLYAGFIAQALPNAKIICLRRNPMDTCLSNFRQLFALEIRAFDYSFDILDTGRYYLLFDRLMRHWRSVFPGRILEIEYEQLIESQEDTTRAMLDHCGLPWEANCLNFEENLAPVATASAVQVRSPMNRSSLHRWKHYALQLGELRQLLEAGGIQVS